MVPNYQQVEGIGIGIPGSIDKNNEDIINSGNVSILKGMTLVKNLKLDLGIDTYIENDARVAALAEAIKGTGKEFNNVCYITISTGLGGAIITNNNIYKGSSNLGGYFGSILLDGKNTCDSLISGTALLREAQQKIDANIKNTVELFELEKNNNAVAKEIIDNFKNNLVILFLDISRIINPEIIILGGGVLKSKDRFLFDSIERFKQKAHLLAKDTIIKEACLDEPGVLGAALLAKLNKTN